MSLKSQSRPSCPFGRTRNLAARETGNGRRLQGVSFFVSFKVCRGLFLLVAEHVSRWTPRPPLDTHPTTTADPGASQVAVLGPHTGMHVIVLAMGFLSSV